MSVRDGLKPTQHPCVFYKSHPTRKHGIKFDQQWIVRQTLGKKTRVSVIGWSSENVKLTDALRTADEFKANHKRNIANPHLPPLPICVADYIKTARKKESEYPLFADFAERFIKNHVKKKLKEATAYEYERQIRKYFIPAWGDIKVFHLQRKQIVKMIEEISDTSPVQANRTLSTIKKMLNYAIDVGLIEINPAARIKPPTREIPRSRALDLDEITTLFGILGELQDRDCSDILRLIVLTAQRPGEIAAMQVSQIRKENNGDLWFEISGEKTKNTEPQRIFLNIFAKKIIEKRIEELGLTHYIFPAGTKTGYMRADVLVKKVQRIQALAEKEGIKYFTAHDLRRSAATGIARLGYGSIIDDILNHKKRGVTRRVYDLYDRGPEIKSALTEWAEIIAQNLH